MKSESKKEREAENWLNLLEKERFDELYLLLCLGIGRSYFKLAGDIKMLSLLPHGYNRENLIRKGEIAGLIEQMEEIVARTEELFSINLNDIYSQDSPLFKYREGE